MPLRPHQIESWVLDIIDRVSAGQPLEDSRVELKAEWTSPERAARQIAGHANAARGTPILWIIGVDEKRGIVGADHNDLASWYSQVQASFNGLAPELTDINVPVGNDTVVALYFETDRIPFVVKNPVHGSKGGGPVSLEVPWRDGTSTISAERANLITLLSPLTVLPDVDILKGDLKTSTSMKDGKEVFDHSLELTIYFVPVSADRVVIPLHQCEAFVEISGWIKKRKLRHLSLHTPKDFDRKSFESFPSSKTIEETSDEIIIYGPGKVYLSAYLETPIVKAIPQSDASVTAKLFPTNVDIPVLINVTLKLVDKDKGETFSWQYVRDKT